MRKATTTNDTIFITDKYHKYYEIQKNVIIFALLTSWPLLYR